MSVSNRKFLLFAFAALLLLVLSAAAAEAQAPCRRCAIAQERCTVNCLGREGAAVRSCLLGCDNAAALCSCDEPATLNSEDYVASFGSMDPNVGVVTASSGTCHSTTPCPSEYGACANWSSFSYCGDPYCGAVPGCGECDEWGRCEFYGPAMEQPMERFRVCFNPQGQSCTEYQLTSVNLGGCSC